MSSAMHCRFLPTAFRNAIGHLPPVLSHFKVELLFLRGLGRVRRAFSIPSSSPATFCLAPAWPILFWRLH